MSEAYQRVDILLDSKNMSEAGRRILKRARKRMLRINPETLSPKHKEQRSSTLAQIDSSLDEIKVILADIDKRLHELAN